jgi:hypothetical protein
MARPILWTGVHAWRNHFSVNAADLLHIQRQFALDEATFALALKRCFQYSRADVINQRTVERVLDELIREDDARQKKETRS